MRVRGLLVTPIKGLRVRAVESVELGPSGARGNRRFYLIDARDRMLNGKQLGDLQAVEADWDEDSGRLSLRFPDGREVAGEVRPGPRAATRFFSRPREDHLVEGPWSEALSEFAGQSLRLLSTASAVDRGRAGAVSLISRASLARLAEVAAGPAVDARRFRMLIEVDGLGAHEEDSWVDGHTRVGEAMLRWRGHVGRCLVTSRDPETGIIDVPMLDVLGEYRRSVPSTEPLPFGIYGEVSQAGCVRVGDTVEWIGSGAR